MGNKKQVVPNTADSDFAAHENFNTIGPIPQAIKNESVDGPSWSAPPLAEQYRQMLPAFLQHQQMNLAQPPKEYSKPEDVAHMTGFRGSKSIWADMPSWLSPGVLAHEATHVMQHNKQDPYNKFKAGDYEYGGLAGLEKARQGKKTIRDFGAEQQAAMVEDYTRVYQAAQEIVKQNGSLTPDQYKYLKRYADAYEPFIRQLLGMEDYDELRYNDSGHINYSLIPPTGDQLVPPNVQPPGLPPGDVVGLTDSPLMGGGPMRVK